MKQVSTDKAVIILQGDNHVRIEINDGAELELSDIEKINAAKFGLVGDKKHTVLFISGIFFSVTHEARIFSASKEVNHNAIAKALLIRNMADRLLANFFIKVNRPLAPTKFFSTEKEAMKWLNEMAVKALKLT